MVRSILFLLSFLFLALSVTAGSDEYADYFRGDVTTDVSRDEVKENIELRKRQLNKMVGETIKLLEDHDSGANVMDDEEYEKLSKRVEIIKKKLERMEGYDDAEIDRQHRRESRRWARRRTRSREL